MNIMATDKTFVLLFYLSCVCYSNSKTIENKSSLILTNLAVKEINSSGEVIWELFQGGQGDHKHIEKKQNVINVKEKITKESRQPVKLNMKQGLLMNQIIGSYALKEVNNEKCKNHTNEFIMGLRAFEPWALQMFDSSSKLQSGILLGNVYEYGSFKQCLQIYHNSDYGPIRGKHCNLKIQPDLYLSKKILSFRNISEKRFEKMKHFLDGSPLVWSICIPDSCKASDVLLHFKKIVTTLSEGVNLTLSLDESGCSSVLTDEKKLTKTEMTIIFCFTIYIVLIIICTLIDLYSTPEKAEKNLIRVFSAYTNSRDIFSTKTNSTSNLDCIHGIRFLSTYYVLLGHRYTIIMFYPLINSFEILEWILQYTNTILLGGNVSVDSFFFVSGIIASITYFKQIKKFGKINWFHFYFQRYMRLTVPLAIVVLFNATLMHHFGSGPLWKDTVDLLQKPCQQYWWATLLHIQNYVHSYPLCMTQTWHLTCDWIFFCFSPLILIPLRRWPIFGYINLCVLYIASVAINFYLAWINDYDGGFPMTKEAFSLHGFRKHYITPHTRASTYIIGIGFGYSLQKYAGKQIKMSYPVLIVGWLLCAITLIAPVLGVHVFFEEEHSHNTFESAIFLSTSKSSWCIGLLWIIWTSVNGYGGPINFLLSLHIFRLLGRIGYAIFLVHMGMQYMTCAASKQPGYFSNFIAVYYAFGDLGLLILIGFLFTIFFESPFAKVLSIVLERDEPMKIFPASDLTNEK